MGCGSTTRRRAAGTPVIFVHEYAGDYRSWEPQMRHFGQRYRAITYNARGYPPSDVPEDVAKYSQARAADDIRSVLDHLKIDKAHVVGLSMGGFATLHFGFRHPARALSLCVAGCGYGAEKGQTERFRAEAETIAAFMPSRGWRCSPGNTPTGRRACSSRTRTRAASPSSGGCWPSIRRWARATRSSACSASGRRCTTWWIR